MARVAEALRGDFPVIAQARGINPLDGIFQVIRLPYNIERDSDLGIIQTRVGFGRGNDSFLDTTRGGRIPDLRYSSSELEAQLQAAVIPSSPSISPELKRPKPEFGSLGSVQFEISNLYLPGAGLSGDEYSSESDPSSSQLTGLAGMSSSTLPPLPDTVEMLEATGAVPLSLPPPREGTRGFNTAIAPSTADWSMLTVSTSVDHQPDDLSNCGTKPRTKSSLLAKLAARSHSQATMVWNGDRLEPIQASQDVVATRALHGSLLVPLDADTSPVDNSLELIQPGTLYRVDNSPELRSRVTTRRGAPLAGSRCLEDILPSPIPASRKRARALSTSSCGPDLAIALDVNVWDQAAEADLPPPSPIPSPLPSPVFLRTSPSDSSRPAPRPRPRKLSKRPRTRIN